MKNFITFSSSIVLAVVLLPFLFVMGVIGAVLDWKLNNYLFNIALSIDQIGNVVGKYFFEALFISTGSTCPFGSTDETISSVIGKNYISGTLTNTGLRFKNTLDKVLGKDHCVKAIGQ